MTDVFASLDAQIAVVRNNSKRRRLRKELERARGKVELRAEVARMGKANARTLTLGTEAP